MTDRPILFSAPMVRALLAGTKTQTRRAWKVQPPPGIRVAIVNNTTKRYGGPGDRLWVRESLRAMRNDDDEIFAYAYAADGVRVRRDPGLGAAFSDGMAFAHLARPGGVPSIHMPRWANRITLNVTGVRVERLQAISGADAIAEGAPRLACYGPDCMDGPDGCNARGCEGARDWFSALWKSINGAESWDANPWVEVVEFERVAQRAPCIARDPRCPCRDGDTCNYAGKNPFPLPKG